MKQRKNQFIEACRFLGCIMIVFCHVPFPSPYGSYVGALARFAVPFFLMISGYFVYDKNLASKARKKLRDTVGTVVVAGAICLVWNSVNSYLRCCSPTRWAQPYMNWHTLVEFLIFNRAIFFNSVFYYFFMLIYLYTIYLIAARLRFTLSHSRLPLALVLTVCAWIIDHYTSKDWYYAGNALLTGLPMFLIGQHLRAHPALVHRVKGYELLLIALGLLLTFVEYRFKRTGNFVYFGQILIAVALLCMCLNRYDKPASQCLVFMGSSCSLCIMVTHCEIRDTLALWMDKNTWYFPFAVLALSILLATLISWIRTCFTRFTKRRSPVEHNVRRHHPA